MAGFDQITTWISDNESLFSGLAAIVALVAIVPAALRPILRRRSAAQSPSAAQKGAQRGSASGGDSATRVDGRPRLAVFPIETHGSEDSVVAAADLMTVELTTLLARGRGCEVISRRSSIAFAKAGGTTEEAGSQLDVRYVVEGQLSQASAGFRISASLVDTERDEVVWSDAFESSTEDVSAVSHSLAQNVASHLGIELTRAEVGRARKHPPRREARDLFLRAQGILFDEGHSRASYQRTIALLTQAIEVDPEYANAHGQLALLVALGHVFGFLESAEDVRVQSLEACRRALEIDDRSSDVLGYVGCAYCDLRQYEQGVALLDRSIEIDPSNAQARAALGTAYVGLGRLEDGASKLEEALRLTPAYKGIAPWATVLAGAYIRLGRLDEAAASLDRALRCDPGFFPIHLTAAGLALAQSDAPAVRRHTSEAKRLYPDLNRETTDRLLGPTMTALLSPHLWPDTPAA